MLKTGETEGWMPPPPNAATLAGQRGYDRLSGFLENARREGKFAPIVENILDPLTADVRGARQFERLTRQQVRRLRSAYAQAMRTVKDTPEEARVKAFIEAQLPAAARAPEGIARVTADLERLAQTTLGRGTAQARYQAAQPTRTYLEQRDAVARLDRQIEKAEAKGDKQQFTAEQQRWIEGPKAKPTAGATGEAIAGRAGMSYRAFDKPEQALGADVSFSSKPFGYGGPYEIEFPGRP